MLLVLVRLTSFEPVLLLALPPPNAANSNNKPPPIIQIILFDPENKEEKGFVPGTGVGGSVPVTLTLIVHSPVRGEITIPVPQGSQGPEVSTYPPPVVE